MAKADEYRKTLAVLQEWDEFLLQNSGLPGPRGNIELAQVVADMGERELFMRYLAYTPDIAPTNTPQEFLTFCGAIGLGRLISEGEYSLISQLRFLACDPRWRMREGVAMALQRVGDRDMDLLLREMQTWSLGNPLEQRAAAAAICEPRLLKQPEQIRSVLAILDHINRSIIDLQNRRSEAFQALRKGLAYCWSVATAALPEEGKPLMEKWLMSPDHDIRWIMRENLKKNRLIKMDRVWVETWQKAISPSA
jgi:hypothetical protein